MTEHEHEEHELWDPPSKKKPPRSHNSAVTSSLRPACLLRHQYFPLSL